MKTASEIIDALGGTTKVARIFGIKAPSVTDWKKNGIPGGRLLYLQLAYPKVFDEPFVLRYPEGARP